MIKEFGIDNFKCFKNETIKLANLNVLTGKNSSGKTSIIQALLFTFQALEQQHGNVLNGRYVKLGQYSDIQNIYSRGKVELKLSMGDNDYEIVLDDTGWSVKRTEEHFDIVYLSADRIGVKNEYDRNEQDIERIGIQGEYAFDYLSRNKTENVPETSFIKDCDIGMNFSNQVNYWLEYLTGYSVKAEIVEGTSIVKVAYIAKGSTKEFRPSHVGTGVSYLATVIIAALSCKKESVLIIENPEIHLHPGAQSKFVEFFAFLASRGLQIILETHSDHIINGVRKEIKRKNLMLDQVAVYFLRQENRISKGVRIDFTSSGSIKNMQDGFFDQFDEDLDELLGFDEYEERDIR